MLKKKQTTCSLEFRLAGWPVMHLTQPGGLFLLGKLLPKATAGKWLSHDRSDMEPLLHLSGAQRPRSSQEGGSETPVCCRERPQRGLEADI